MNKFKKKTRSKMIAASIAILSSAAVVSTGFAAWVISGGDSKEATGTIKADTVSDTAHTLSAVTWDTNKGVISFGAPKETDTTKGKFLNYSGDIHEELVATGTFTVSNLAEDWSISNLFDTTDLSVKEVTAEDAIVDSSNAIYPSGGKYVCELPKYKTGPADKKQPGIYIEVGDQTTENAHTNNGKFKLSVVFGWGSATGHTNPFTYYSNMENNSSNRSLAMDVLTNVHKLNECRFSLTIKTNA